MRLRFDRYEDWEHLHDLLGDGDAELLQDRRLELNLDPYGYRWFASTAKANGSRCSHHCLAAQTNSSGRSRYQSLKRA